jgi:sulfatase maturation enzyme AslB (radical SAM superfamily)
MSSPDKSGCFDLLLGYGCNIFCVFCSQDLAWRERPALTFAQAAQEIYKAREAGYREIGLVGGEITIRPDLERLVLLAQKCGFEKIGILTNGIKLGSLQYARRLVSRGLNVVNISIHGHRAEIHDKLVAVDGAFVKAIAAIKHLQGLGVHVGIKILINKLNYRELPEMLSFFGQCGTGDLTISYPLYTGDFLAHIEEMKVPLPEVADHMRRALTAYRLSDPGAKLPYLRNFPPCLLPDFIELNSDLDPEVGNLLRPAEGGQGLPPKRHVAACETCALKDKCLGVDTGYVDCWGDGEFRPLPRDPSAV